MPEFCVGTQRNLYSTGLRLGITSSKTQILGFASAKTQIKGFALAPKYQHVGIPNAKFWRRGHCPTPTPDARYFASQWNIGYRTNGLLGLVTYILQTGYQCFLACFCRPSVGNYDVSLIVNNNPWNSKCHIFWVWLLWLYCLSCSIHEWFTPTLFVCKGTPGELGEIARI